MESPDDRQINGLSQAQQELIAEAKLQRFKKRQRLLEYAYGDRPRSLRILTTVGYCAVFLMLVGAFTVSKHSEYTVYGNIILVLLVSVQIHFQYINRRIDALLELLGENEAHQSRLDSQAPREQ